MGTEKASRPILIRALWIAVAVFIFYIVGVFVRHAYGVRFEITNRSEATLHDVTLGFAGWKYRQEISVGEVESGKTRRFFLRPRMKSSYFLNFTDAHGVRHTEEGETYITRNDSADVRMKILADGKVEMDLPDHHLISWESWFGFL